MHLSAWNRTRQPFSVAVIEIMHYHSLRERYGHPVVGQVLQEFAKQMKSVIRGTDILAGPMDAWR